MKKHIPGKKKQLTRFVLTEELKQKIEARDEVEFWARLYYNGERTNYAISSLGTIRRIKKYSKRHPDYVAQYINRDGYLQVQLTINGKYVLPSVHRLVAITFIQIPQKYIDAGYSMSDLQVNHKNGITYDPYVGNLEWCTPKENDDHAFLNGLRSAKFGENHPNSVLTEEIVNVICKYLERGMRNIDVASKTHVPTTLVNQIKNKCIWTSISCNYNIQTQPRKSYKYITENDAHNICKMIEFGLNNVEISKKTGIQKHIIGNIRNRKRWIHVSSKYNF